jgi:hypothetical protein
VRNNTGWTLGYPTAGSQYTEVVFGVSNLGTVRHRFHTWACTALHSTVGRGVFTIQSTRGP